MMKKIILTAVLTFFSAAMFAQSSESYKKDYKKTKAKEVLKKADKNKNGFIEKSEKKESIGDDFEKFDKNKDNKVSKKELKKGIRDRKKEIRKEEKRQVQI